MICGQIYDYIRLTKAETNKVIAAPFLEIDEELWNTEMRSVTMCIDPDKVKRGCAATRINWPFAKARQGLHTHHRQHLEGRSR